MTDEDPFAALGGLEGLLRQAQEIQQQLSEAQEASAGRVVEGHAGGGAVRVLVTGDMEFHSVHIDPAAVDPHDVEMLEDLVLAALHDAVAQVRRLNQEAMGALGGLAAGLPGGLPGSAGLPDASPPGLPGPAGGAEDGVAGAGGERPG